MEKTAKCCCGSCIVKVKTDPVIHGVCHCNNCKKRTGSAFGISAYFKASEVELLSGHYHQYLLENEQGKQQRYFCSSCGTTLYWKAEIFNDLIGIAGGCFVDNPLPAPAFSSMNDNQCHWLSLAGNIKLSFSEEDIPN